MLYKKNSSAELSTELFKNPTCEYRGTPFWAWNDELIPDELLRQIDVFREMGFGGFHMHVRTGLKNEYLSDEFMKLIRICTDKAKSENMFAWLYDEDRWPSGFAGGIITRDSTEFRKRKLILSDKTENEDGNGNGDFGDESNGDGKFLACYDIFLNDDGTLKAYRRIGKNDCCEGRKWYARLVLEKPTPRMNNGTYIDTLNPEAVKRFVEVTHERYKETVGNEFDKTVPAIFTDEPQMDKKRCLKNAHDTDSVAVMAWTDKLGELYKEHYGEDILDTLPELFWDTREVSLARYRYHDFTSELFASSFADVIGKWCDENGIALTGHLLMEPTLESQTVAVGEAMRSYRSFALPGIDMLCNCHEFTTAKQAQSATHQYGYEGVLSELYGVTAWDCDFRRYKHQGDWQAALGITVRVPHLSWYAMEGEAKRDYPASISYQSSWHKKWADIEDHFARVNTAMTRGKPIVRVAVIHPVESFWLHFGPNDTSRIYRENLEEKFKNVTEWLIGGSIDFDYICESELPKLCEKGGAPLRVGKMSYDAVVIPGNETLRGTTYDRLEAFASEGGHLLIMGNAPSYCDARPTDRGQRLASLGSVIDFSRASLFSSLECDRDICIRHENGIQSSEYLYQLREDNNCKWLFVAHLWEPSNFDVDGSHHLKIAVKGEYKAEVYDTLNGSVCTAKYEQRDGFTYVYAEMYPCDSLLLRLEGGKGENMGEAPNTETDGVPLFGNTVEYRLGEQNVLVLDFAEYRLSSDEAFARREEILRLDNILRERLSLPHRGGGIAQPYTIKDVATPERAVLRFVFESEIEYEGAALALEDASETEITFNGESVSNEPFGNYVDIRIYKVHLPKIKKGKNEIIISKPFGAGKNLENMFILGDFGVRIVGSEGIITEKPEKIPFGDLTRYGFPFYGGTVTYLLPFETKNGNISVCSSLYRGTLQTVGVDGEEKGDIIYPPYKLSVTGLEPGRHELELTLYLHRYNTFGPIHLADETESWHGPNIWRTEGNAWSYEYALKRTGVLKHPEIG